MPPGVTQEKLIHHPSFCFAEAHTRTGVGQWTKRETEAAEGGVQGQRANQDWSTDMSMAWPPYTNSSAVPPSTKARRPWVGAWLHKWGCNPASPASATKYHDVKVVPSMAMKEKMRMLRKEGMKVVVRPTLPNSKA